MLHGQDSRSFGNDGAIQRYRKIESCTLRSGSRRPRATSQADDRFIATETLRNCLQSSVMTSHRLRVARGVYVSSNRVRRRLTELNLHSNVPIFLLPTHSSLQHTEQLDSTLLESILPELSLCSHLDECRIGRASLTKKCHPLTLPSAQCFGTNIYRRLQTFISTCRVIGYSGLTKFGAKNITGLQARYILTREMTVDRSALLGAAMRVF